MSFRISINSDCKSKLFSKMHHFRLLPMIKEVFCPPFSVYTVLAFSTASYDPYQTLCKIAINPLPAHTANDKILPVSMSLCMLLNKSRFCQHITVMKNEQISLRLANGMITPLCNSLIDRNTHLLNGKFTSIFSSISIVPSVEPLSATMTSNGISVS